MKRGFIKLHRSLADHPLWVGEKFTRGQAWADLLMLATFKTGHIRVRGQRIDLERGQVGWSTEKLAIRWKWSRGKVIRFLNELEMDGQIVQKKSFVSTVLTITNYSRYQDGDTADDAADGQQTASRQYSRRPADGTLKKNVKNVKNVKNSLGRFVKPTIDQLAQYCLQRGNKIDPHEFIDHYEANGWRCGKNRTPMRDWKAAVRTWEAKRRKEQPQSRVVTVDEYNEMLANGEVVR